MAKIIYVIGGLAVAWVWIDSLFIHRRRGEFNKTSKIVWSGVVTLVVIVVIAMVIMLHSS